MNGIGGHQVHGGSLPAHHLAEAHRFQVVGDEARRVGIGDVAGQDLLPLAEPGQPLLDRPKRSSRAPVHAPAVHLRPFAADQLASACLTMC